jgi:hypothetical protein
VPDPGNRRPGHSPRRGDHPGGLLGPARHGRATLEAPGAGTIYVVAHSIRGGGIAPGNYLKDTDTETSRVKPGAAAHVGNLDYHVTSSEKITKTRLGDNQTIWSDIPNHLVVITCLEHADGSPSTDNLILTATRTD